MAFAHPAPTSPVVGFVCFADAAPTPGQLAGKLGDEFEDAGVQTLEGAEGATLEAAVVEMDGVTLLLTPVDSPVPGGHATRWCHPVWWDDIEAVESHRAHVMVTAVAPADDEDPRARALRTNTLFSLACGLTCELPGSVAVFSATAGLTVPAVGYQMMLETAFESQQLPVDLWVSTWLQPLEDGTVTGHTAGLDAFGHADLVVEHSGQEPPAVYELLSSVAAYIVGSGEQMVPGQVLSYTDGRELPVSEHAEEGGHVLLGIDF